MAKAIFDWKSSNSHAGAGSKTGDVKIQTSYRPKVNERWVRPDGIVETNVKMDIVRAAAIRAMKP